MNTVEFTQIVRRMRAAQKAYFKGLKKEDLIAAKMLEAEVDKALKDGVVTEGENPSQKATAKD